MRGRGHFISVANQVLANCNNRAMGRTVGGRALSADLQTCRESAVIWLFVLTGESR